MRSRSILSQSRLFTARFHQQYTDSIAKRCIVQCQRLNSTQARITRDDAKEEQPKQEAKKEPNAPIGSKLFAFAIGGGAAFSYAWYRRQNAPATAGSQSDGFIRYTLIDKEDTSSSCSIFTLQPVSSKSTLKSAASSDASILSIQIKQPQLQIARAYTCLPPTPGQPADSIRLLIRKEEKGEVSSYLHSMPLGSDVEVRGSYVDYAFPANTKEVIFLAGGTGIAPALKTAEVLREQANVHILWANKKREDCSGGRSDHKLSPGLLTYLYSLVAKSTDEFDEHAPSNTIVLLLNLLKSSATSNEMTVDYFVDEEGSYIKSSTITNLIKSANATDGSKILIVSGPNGFIEHWAGPKQWVDGSEVQGPLKGVLSTLKLQDWTIIKL